MPDCARCNRPLGKNRVRNMRTGACEECTPLAAGDRFGVYGQEDTAGPVEIQVPNQPVEA